MDDAGFSKNSSSSMKPISLVGRHCYPFFRDHLHNPYPTSQEKESIVFKANSPDVTMVSVSNWFANSRRRSGWIELCNEYCNGDNKLMVEICSHVLINGGNPRSKDPPALVDKILDMERKVRSWHEEETEPRSWTVALCELIREYETRLRIDAENKSRSSDVDFTVDSPKFTDEKNEDQETHSVVGVKRSHREYMLGSYTSDVLPRSLSISSISSVSSLSSEDYSSEEEERPNKRGKVCTRLTKDERCSTEFNENRHQHVLRTDPQLRRLKRRFSATLFSEDSGDLERTDKRPRFAHTDLRPSGGSDEPLILNEQPSIHFPSDTTFQPAHSANLDISLIPTVDLQPPDASWLLDIDLYDWTSSPDILSMMDASSQTDCGRSFSAFMATENRTDCSDQWLQNFFLADLPETKDLSPVQPEAKDSGSTSIPNQMSNCLTTPSTPLLNDTLTLHNSDTICIHGTVCDPHKLEPRFSDVEGEIQFDPDLLLDNNRWLSSGSLAGSDLELDPLPADFSRAFLTDFSCTESPFPVENNY